MPTKYLYTGILIMTSNRVGRLDEGFTSRIHLSIRFANLSEDSRYKIWDNLLSRLYKILQESPPGIEGSADIVELQGKLTELAKVPMNGREIRNSISSARRLAMWNHERLEFKHLQVVISEAAKFNEYLLVLQGEMSGVDISRRQHAR